MKSYVEYSGIFLKADTKTMHDGGKDFIRTLKTHLELHHKLKYNLPPEELHPEGPEFDQVPGAGFSKQVHYALQGEPK